MITGIVAIAQDNAIGKDGKLPWHYSSDLKFFKKTTLGSALVMGRKTYDSIGRPLPERLNIVLTRGPVSDEVGPVRLRTRDEVLAVSRYLNGGLFVIGGGEIYRTFAHDIDRWIVTEVPVTVPDADTFFPADLLDNFAVEKELELDDGLKVKFMERRLGAVHTGRHLL